jgi:hypothetical protein
MKVLGLSFLMIRKCLVCLTVASCLFVGDAAASAATIAGWEMTGVSVYGPSPFAATTSDATVVVGGLTRGSGVTTSGTAAANAWGGNGWNGAANVNDSIAAGDFITFTVTPIAGYELSLSSIDPYNIRRSGTGPTTGQWQYSLDGVSFTDIGSAITWGGNTSATGNLQGSIDLTGIAALQNVSATTTVSFRLANYNASASGGTWYINNFQAGNDFSLQGISSVAIPEPATVALAGLCLMSTIVSARRSTR